MEIEDLVDDIIENNSIAGVDASNSKSVLISLGNRYQEALILNDKKLMKQIQGLISETAAIVPVPEKKEPKQISKENKKKLLETTSMRPVAIITKKSAIQEEKERRKNESKMSKSSFSTPKSNKSSTEVTSVGKCKSLSKGQLEYYNEIIDDLLSEEKEEEEEYETITNMSVNEKQELLYAIDKRKNSCFLKDDFETPKKLDAIIDKVTEKPDLTGPRIKRRLEELRNKKQMLIEKIQEAQQQLKEERDNLAESCDAATNLFNEDVELMWFNEMEKIEKFKEDHRTKTFPEVEALHAQQHALAANREYEALKQIKVKTDKLEKKLKKKEEMRLDDIEAKRLNLLQLKIDTMTSGFEQRWDTQVANLEKRLMDGITSYQKMLEAVNAQIAFYEKDRSK